MDVIVPGGRDVRGTLDDPADPGSPEDAGDRSRAAVAACPPHPRMGGSRSDGRLRATSDALNGAGVACLRFDYGDWDGGRGETADARNAVGWLADRYDRVGLLGYSFGGAVAVLAAASLARSREGTGTGTDGGHGAGSSGSRAGDPRVSAVSVLAPASSLGEAPDLDAAAALADVDCPVRVVYGERDTTADWEPIVDRARELGHETVAVRGDHHFFGQFGKVGGLVAEFLADEL